ncbi:hypothetical protein LTR01_000710 [Friedmanniomyces endolithicus]|nr:hypothetical protein LTR01_000710 [Friedmanniomyces endolithicus]
MRRRLGALLRCRGLVEHEGAVHLHNRQVAERDADEFAFTDLYDTTTGDYPTSVIFIARPVVGGMYSLLALNSAPSSGYVTPS